MGGRARVLFFFQAEDGIRDKLVTGVQTCALPICDRGVDTAIDQDGKGRRFAEGGQVQGLGARHGHDFRAELQAEVDGEPQGVLVGGRERSEEHTSELQSLAYLVCRLLLEKKKQTALAMEC